MLLMKNKSTKTQKHKNSIKNYAKYKTIKYENAVFTVNNDGQHLFMRKKL